MSGDWRLARIGPPGQADSERCTTTLVKPDLPTVRLYHRFGDRQTQAGATLFAEGHKRFKNPVTNFRRYPRPLVLDGNLQGLALIPKP